MRQKKDGKHLTARETRTVTAGQYLLDKQYQPVREFMYRYHRLGLDVMSSKPVKDVPK
jgi:hypothetical protein